MKRLVLKPKTCMFWLTFLCLLVALSDRSLVQTWVLCSCFTATWQLMSEELFLNYFCVYMYQRSSLLSSLPQKDLPTHTQTGITGFLLLSSHLGTTRSFSSIPWINCNSIMSSVRGFLYMYIQGTTWDCADTLCWSSLTFFLVLSSSYNVSNGLPTAINPSQFIEISLSDVYMDFY